MRVDERLDELAETLEKRGGDKLRLQVVKRARAFKRSWIEMAEALVEVRKSKAYKKWGYHDLHEYCALELHIKGATVDKLTASYQTIERHAPEVFRRDGVAQPVPQLDSVDYFSRAMNRDASVEKTDVGDEVVSALKTAVFDEAKPVSVLKRKFNPILYPKPESAAKIELLTKTRAATRRLESLLPQAETLQKKRSKQIMELLAELREEIDGALEKERKAAAAAAKPANENATAAAG